MVQPLSQSADLKFLVFGAGAIGTYIGGSLALEGHQVVFVEQPEMVKELRQKGLRLDLTIDESVALRLSQGRKRALRGVAGTKDAFIIAPRSFVIEPSLKEALKFGPFDTAIFALKSFDTLSALEGLKPFADELPPLLCLSNGVENEQAIARVLGADKVIYGTVTSAIGRRGPGDIVLEKLRGVGITSSHPLSSRLVAAFMNSWR